MKTNPSPRVLFAVERLTAGSGGISRAARLMARSLGEQVAAGRIMVNCISLSDQFSPTDYPFPVTALNGSKLKFVFHVLRGLRRADLALFDFAGTARAQLTSTVRRVPSVLMIHGIEVWENAMPHHLRACRRATYLISNSAFTRSKAHETHGGFARAKVCWLATEDDCAPAETGSCRSLNILVLGRMQQGRNKGHRDLIDCMPFITHRLPMAKLIIVGVGNARAELEAHAKASPAATRIEFKGFVSDCDMSLLWERSALFAMPSRGEGFGLVYVEAMRYGIPVIASTLDAAKEINIDGTTGFNVDPSIPGDLEAAIIRVLSDADLRKRMGGSGNARWRQHFRYSAFKDRFLKIMFGALQMPEATHTRHD